MNLSALLSSARTSGFKRWWLQHALNWSIPFNRPHGFHVRPLPEGGISVRIPNWRINHNHIRGVHACALATAAEMCSGLSLLEKLDPRQYRLIMRSLLMEYHYQAKMETTATCVLSDADLESKVIAPLRSSDRVDHTSTVRLEDKAGNHIATGTITWQVKAWDKVRTRR